MAQSGRSNRTLECPLFHGRANEYAQMRFDL